jgi:hypothetical protein
LRFGISLDGDWDFARDRAADSFTFEELPPQEVRGMEGRVMIFAVSV